MVDVDFLLCAQFTVLTRQNPANLYLKTCSNHQRKQQSLEVKHCKYLKPVCKFPPGYFYQMISEEQKSGFQSPSSPLCSLLLTASSLKLTRDAFYFITLQLNIKVLISMTSYIRSSNFPEEKKKSTDLLRCTRRSAVAWGT